MSIDESDFFKHLESSFVGDSSFELPLDPLDGIVAESNDPVDCARSLHGYTLENPEDAQTTIMRRGLAKLADKYNEIYLHKTLAVTAGAGFAVPEPKPYLRKREVMNMSQYEG